MKLRTQTIKLLWTLVVILNLANIFLFQEWTEAKSKVSLDIDSLNRKLTLLAEVSSLDPETLEGAQYFITEQEALSWLDETYSKTAIDLNISNQEENLLAANFIAADLEGLLRALESTAILTNLSIESASASVTSDNMIEGNLSWRLHQ